ncbi:hypothetical protein VB738_14210 [Cyanobium gracile UHCC 0139]|uniref:Plastid lipid-associated protein/fibrillin conserved domain-containing protein n=1 Tax=Cyanobium gracile UHCC 0139 TaxID=3110308 RepID=A0ABU5RXG9_9CYAN|nr:hypothetical protein [Cyanobium gracile]MEA5392413.1 hypothetical protein [Cyanobium gracile UHCC 0139]
MIPDAPWLLERERRCRRDGTGLTTADLVGCWRLEQIWNKGSRQPASAAAALLRGLAARLRLSAAGADSEDGGLRLANSVRLGALELRFEGVGRLEGRRPLLVFSFERLLLVLGGRVLIERALPQPDPLRRPFFALIAAEHHGWLAARGRGGGLALWLLEGTDGENEVRVNEN